MTISCWHFSKIKKGFAFDTSSTQSAHTRILLNYSMNELMEALGKLEYFHLQIEN